MTQKYVIQLYEGIGGFSRPPLVAGAGGTMYVATAGVSLKQPLTDAAGATLTNPVSFTRGGVEFYVPNAVVSVDLYIHAPGGQFLVKKTVKPGEHDVGVDITVRDQTYVIPFDIADTTAATETDTGFDLPTDAIVHAQGMGVNVKTVDGTETIDVGILASEAGGDANGFMALVDVATAGMIAADAAVTVGGTETYFSANTLGALVSDFIVGTNVDQDYGLFHRKPHRGDGTAKSISYTLTAGTDTAIGFIVIPVTLPDI